MKVFFDSLESARHSASTACFSGRGDKPGGASRGTSPRFRKSFRGPLRAKPRPFLSFAGKTPRPRPSFALCPQALGGRSAGPRAKQPFAAYGGLAQPGHRRTAKGLLVGSWRSGMQAAEARSKAAPENPISQSNSPILCNFAPCQQW